MNILKTLLSTICKIAEISHREFDEEAIEFNFKRKLADAYISRIHSFQAQLIGWGITWNIALIGASFLPINYVKPYLGIWSLAFALALNFILGEVYSREHDIKIELVKTYRLDLLSSSIATTGETFSWLKYAWWGLQLAILLILATQNLHIFSAVIFKK